MNAGGLSSASFWDMLSSLMEKQCLASGQLHSQISHTLFNFVRVQFGQGESIKCHVILI